MISVIIPYMAVDPFPNLLPDLLDDLDKQTVPIQVLVEEQPSKGSYINKNKLLNQGIVKSEHDFVFFCDADMRIKQSLLERMHTRLTNENLDVIFPKFRSPVSQKYKIADGTPFVKKRILQKHGFMDEKLLGIGGVSFPFLNWCIDNTAILCSEQYKVKIHEKRGKPEKKSRSPKETRVKLREVKKELPKRLKKRGWWPE